MKKAESFINLVLESFESGILKKIVFSRPKESEIKKISGRLVSHGNKTLLALEYSLPGDTVSHKNLEATAIRNELSGFFCEYCQANLLTTLGDIEWKISKSNSEVLLGEEKLKRKLLGDKEGFERAISSLDTKKNRIIPQDSPFLIKLGISDKNGRVHDKKQAKYRQINRFVEHLSDVYDELPEGELTVYDLCCGKSYLSFAVYYYLTSHCQRRVKMLGVDLKRDVIAWCDKTARELGFSGMRFLCDDVNKITAEGGVDLVISLHACDLATDVVINRAIDLGAKVILSTPCCHKYLNDKIGVKDLDFVIKYPHLRNKLCEAVTDALRAQRLEANGYKTQILELTDPENTPKNTLIRAIKKGKARNTERYNEILEYLMGTESKNYLKEIEN
jgi:hypothetical protein